MQAGYFNAAWHDIKNSPGWFGKLLVLGLVSLVPIFGWIVVAGYLYGWARDIAWGVHATPADAHAFGNEDGQAVQPRLLRAGHRLRVHRSCAVGRSKWCGVPS